MQVSDGVRALEEGRAFVELSGWGVTLATGDDAVAWLNDLVTNRVDDIGINELRRTLFLDRTGRVRADVHVGTTHVDDRIAGLVVYQDPVQPTPFEQLLSPYVLSSAVELGSGGHVGLAIAPGDIRQVQFMAWPGPGDRVGHTLIRAEDRDATLDVIRRSDRVTLATEQDAEVYRIHRGAPRFGVDFGDDWLPSEAGFDVLVDRSKGCFLGQESVARIRNLGHPPRLVQAFVCGDPVTPMAGITAGGERIGRITSVAPNDDGSTACIGWVRWEAREADVEAEGGVSLTRRPRH
jgi:folate-binding protein YgfZ